ncbi:MULTISPECIES: hypothetical protein [unclassified Rhizobium]|nr:MULTISPECIES: hypothetical protein [unclassified Rhizobium]MBB3397060.1 ribosome-associated translation inhibitor RaiA [Rhizobium sp. BK060]MBB4170713.1 ribosome-associated translation inhibitor RaiA [Rhizobium sp. BK538]TCM76016.1 hypothetical protein EV291_111115 [Rhizobium sp. BK068]
MTTSLPTNEVEDFGAALDVADDAVVRRLNRHLDKLQDTLGEPVVLTEE